MVDTHHLWVIKSSLRDPNIDSVWLLVLSYGIVDSFITYCVLANVEGSWHEHVTRVRPHCLFCVFAQSAELHRLCTSSFHQMPNWNKWSTGSLAGVIRMLVDVSLLFPRSHLIKHTDAHTQVHTLHQNWCGTSDEGQTVSTSYRGGLKCHGVHASKWKKCDKFAYVM